MTAPELKPEGTFVLYRDGWPMDVMAFRNTDKNAVEVVRRDTADLAALPEVQALLAAAVMEALALVRGRGVKGQVIYGDATIEAIDQAIRALIRPDAMSALEAYRDREVAKALEGAKTAIRKDVGDGDISHGAAQWVCDTIDALIPQVKP